MFHNPDFALDADEAKQYADALKLVADQYPYRMNPKLFAWFNLTMVMGMIYGPRLMVVAADNQKRPKLVQPIRTTEAAPAQPAPPKPEQPASPITPPELPNFGKGVTNPSQIFGFDFTGRLEDNPGIA
jgi:hypothetical protein